MVWFRTLRWPWLFGVQGVFRTCTRVPSGLLETVPKNYQYVSAVRSGLGKLFMAISSGYVMLREELYRLLSDAGTNYNVKLFDFPHIVALPCN